MNRRSTWTPIPLLAAVSLVAVPPPLGANCSELHRNRVPNPVGTEVRFVTESAGAPVEGEAIAEAVAMWQTACAANVPRFGPAGKIVVRLRFHDGPNDVPGCGDGCACTFSNTLATADGDEYLASAITHLFERHRDGRGYCRAHRAETLAHEIGHVLGFRHPDDPYAPECAGEIMSFSRDRAVRPADCRALAAVWNPVPLPGAPNYDHLKWRPRPSGLLLGAAPPAAAETEGTLPDPHEQE